MSLGAVNLYKVYGKEPCPYCAMAKALLESLGEPYEYITLKSPDELRELVPTARTVPQIFKDGEYIGGFNELKASFN